ncbi:MAG: transglutaminase-like domain-containing protein [Desulfomonilaceae bacterium]|nr:transglutaminase-like domain-containing protein [Desulfomonilaceae bacterium]
MKRDITQRIARIASMEDHEVELAASALLIARLQYPSLDAPHYLAGLDEMAERLRRRMQVPDEPEHVVNEINTVVFEEEGFRGNTENYYDPRNSFLNEVLDRKLGIPITLSIVYLEVGRRAGLKTYGIGLPGHFIVGLLTDSARVFIDPFNRGQVLTEDACRRIVISHAGTSAGFNRSFLDPVRPKQIVVRLMRNLKGVYLSMKNQTRALALINWILILAPDAIQELLERAAYYESVGDYGSAATDLEKCASLTRDEEERNRLRAKVAMFRKHKTSVH